MLPVNEVPAKSSESRRRRRWSDVNAMAVRLALAHVEPVTFVVFDFDGVMTDNRVLVAEDGRESVFCSRADGLGVQMLARAGVGCLILSTETNPVVSARAAKLGVECVQGLGDAKGEALRGILRDRGIDPAAVAYVGNDVNDVECLRQVGVPVCVADAWPAARRAARFVTARRGGDGAVREVCDLVLEARRRLRAGA